MGEVGRGKMKKKGTMKCHNIDTCVGLIKASYMVLQV